jgi:hypothetical protein
MAGQIGQAPKVVDFSSRAAVVVEGAGWVVEDRGTTPKLGLSGGGGWVLDRGTTPKSGYCGGSGGGGMERRQRKPVYGWGSVRGWEHECNYTYKMFWLEGSRQ